MLKKILVIFIVSVIAIVLLGIKIYPKSATIINSIGNSDKSSLANDDHATQQTKGQSTKHRDPTRPETFPFGRKVHEDLAKKYPDKFAIVKKMFYSWDNIHNAQGEYEWGSKNDGLYKGQFYVDLDKKINRVKLETIQNGKVAELENMLLKNDTALVQLPDKKVYAKLSSLKGAKKNQYLSFGQSVITESEWYALIYDNYPDWTYKVEEKDGAPVYQIEGEIKDRISSDLAGHFTMTVSKDTGALLDLKCFGHGKKVIFFVTGKNIQLNKGISNEEKVFRLDVTGDKKLSFHDFNSQTLGMQTVKGKKTGGVSK